MRVISGGAELDQFSTDSGIIRLRPRAAYFVQTEDEVMSGLQMAMAEGLPVTPRGGGTSIPSQSVGRGAILLQERRLSELLPDGRVVCEPGLVKADLNSMLTSHGRWMPVDPSSYASCTIGGMVANNSSGVRTPKYGSTIDFISELRVIIPGETAKAVIPVSIEEAVGGDAQVRKAASLILENQTAIAQERPRVTKNSSGYRLERVLHDGVFDLPKLFVGSEGTLCVITRATFATVPKPKWRTLFIAESSLAELNQVAEAFSAHSPTALELVDKSVFRTMNRQDRIAKYSRSEDDYMVFCEYDGAEGEPDSKVEEVAGSKASRYDPIVLTAPTEIVDAWEVRNETLTLALEIRKEGKILVPGVEDLVVPPDRLADLLSLLTNQFGKRGLEYISYGHARDANLHARPLLDPSKTGERRTLDELMEDCFEAVWRMGGSITGEHGDGMLRAKYVRRQYPKTFWIMQELKKLYDPKGVLNPGVKIA